MIFIYCDSYWRDSLGIGLLATELNGRGVDTSVVPFDIWPEINEILKKEDAVIINHGAGERNKQIYESAKQKGSSVFIIHTEGRPNTTEQVGWYRSQDGIGDSVFVWSEFIGNLYKKTTPIVTGNPRFDVYRPEYQYLLENPEITRAIHGLHPKRKIILVASGHPQAKFRRYSHAFNRKDWKDLKVPFDPDETAKYDYDQRERFLNWVINLHFWAKDNDHQIIVKPHPMESSIYWEIEAERYGFLAITQEFAHNLINVCDVLVNRGGCTTTLEAALLGKPVISIEAPIREGLAMDTFKIASYAKSSDELIRLVVSSKPFGDDGILKEIGIMQDNPSHIEIANILSELPMTPSDGRMFLSQRTASQKMAPYAVPAPGFNTGKQTTPFKINEIYTYIKRKGRKNE